MKKTFFIHATNVHVGGGRSLLMALLSALPADLRVVALLDTRMQLPAALPSNLEIRWVPATIRCRLAAEWWLSRTVGPEDSVLCFGNLPPLFRLRGWAIAFVQNRYLIDKVGLHGFPLKTRLRLGVERLWLSSKIDHVHAFAVQTPSMQRLMEAFSDSKSKPVHVLPFTGNDQGYCRSGKNLPGTKDVDFIYVASGEPHKNHRALIEAWGRLAREGLFPSLWLTLDRQVHAELCAWVDEQKKIFGLKIENLSGQSHEQVIQLYGRARALIYPSTFESFGLPLIEAQQAGLAVLASELDYVRDILDPEETFDPLSAVSIARAVKRFMGWQETPLPLANAAVFLNAILDKCERPCAS